jgi:hypothetical protein
LTFPKEKYSSPAAKNCQTQCQCRRLKKWFREQLIALPKKDHNIMPGPRRVSQILKGKNRQDQKLLQQWPRELQRKK